VKHNDVVDDESGIGLIEIVISMFLVALIAMAFLPLLIRTYSTTSLNTTTATATQLLDANVDAARTTASNCQAVTNFVATAITTVTDERGVVYQPHRALVGTCPAGYPGTVGVRTWITELGKTQVVAEATTLVYLTKATP
jgi:Tfp pilus assembly protein PilV